MIPHQPRGSCCAAERLEPRTLLAELVVGIGDGTPRALQFVDGDGTAVRVTIRRGMLAVRFTGDGLAQAVEGRDVRVTGGGVALASAAASGTSGRTSITFTASGGDGRVVMGAITADGPLKDFLAPQGVVTGTLTTGGPIRRLQLLRAENATITLGGGRGSSSVEIAEGAFDSDLSSAAPLRRLHVGSWTGVDGGDTITAPFIGKAVVAGDFVGDINADALRSFEVEVGNRVERSVIRVTGNVGRFVVSGSVTDTVLTVGGNIGFVSVALLLHSRVYAGVRALPEGVLVPGGVADFVAPSTIRTFRQASSPGTDSSVVAARFIGTVDLGEADTRRTGGCVFVADRINRVIAWTGIGPYRRETLSKLTDGQRSVGPVELRAV